MTWPFTFRAARPMIWRSEVFDRRNPIFSASSIPINEVSGRSNHSRRRFTHTTTSMTPMRKSRSISRRSRVSISEWRYLTLRPFSARYWARSSLDFFVIVVMIERSHRDLALAIFRISESTMNSISSIAICGSMSPVGRMICSAMISDFSYSYFPGVAETNIVCPLFCSNSWN